MFKSALSASFEYLYIMGLCDYYKYFHYSSAGIVFIRLYIVASELKDPIWHSLEWQIGSFSSEATIYRRQILTYTDGSRAERVKLQGE